MNKKIWNLKNIMIGILSAAAIAFIYSFIPNNNNNKEVTEIENTSKEVIKTFHYSTPTDWMKMNSEELNSYKAAYIQSGSQKVKDYSGKSLSISINEIEGIHSEDNKVKLILLDMFIPENSSSYINVMYKESTQKFKWGLDNGQLSKINENKLTTFKDKECYLNDFELNSGMRMITYLMQNDSLKDNVYQIGIFIEPNTVYKNFQTDIQLVLESLEITNH